MRVAQFAVNGTPSWGFVRGDDVWPVATGPGIDEALFHGLDLAMLEADATGDLPLSEVSLLAPVPKPPQFVGVGLNYRRHAEEAGVEIPVAPLTFAFYTSAIAAPGQPIELPHFTDEVDWEVELGVVIGTTGRDIAKTDALDHVAGYTIINDVSARDIQMSEGQWTRAKSFDTFKPMGPWITTVDELGAADGLAIELRLNGEVKQSSSTDDLIFDVPTLISFLSQSITLEAGSVISTGTPAGVGFARDPAEYLQAGDTVTLDIEGIGSLTNPVVAAS